MRLAILAARRQRAIESIAAHAERLTGEPVDLVSGIKGPDSEHKQLHMLERLDGFLATVDNAPPPPPDGFTLDEILAVEGLTKTSIAALEAAFAEPEEGEEQEEQDE